MCVLDKSLRGHVSQIIPGEWALMSGLGVLWAEVKVSPTVAHGEYLVPFWGRGFATPSP